MKTPPPLPPRKSPSKSPKHRKKPGPKPGARAHVTRQQRRLEQRQKEAFLPRFDRFLELLRTNSNHRPAMEETGLPWSEISSQMANDPALKQRYEAALALREEFRQAERLDSMHSRAVDGVPEPMVSAGREVTTRTVYSDDLLARLVTADNPAKFASRTKGELTVNNAETLADLVSKIEMDTPPGATGPVTPPPSDANPKPKPPEKSPEPDKPK